MFDIREFVKKYGPKFGLYLHSGIMLSKHTLYDAIAPLILNAGTDRFVKIRDEAEENEAKDYLQQIRNIYLHKCLDQSKALEASLQEEIATNNNTAVKKKLVEQIKSTLLPVFSEICFGVSKEVMMDMLVIIKESSKTFGKTYKNIGDKEFSNMTPEEKMLTICHYVDGDFKKIHQLIEDKIDFRADMYDATSFAKTRSVEDINKNCYQPNESDLSDELMKKYSTGDIKVYDISKTPNNLLIHATRFDRFVYGNIPEESLATPKYIKAKAKRDYEIFQESNQTPYGSRCLSVIDASRPVTFRDVDNNIMLLYGEIDPELTFSVAPYDGYTSADYKNGKGDDSAKIYGGIDCSLIPIYATCQYLVDKAIENKTISFNNQMNEVATVILNDNSTTRFVKPTAIVCYNTITPKEVELAKQLNLPIVYAECVKEFEKNWPSTEYVGKTFSSDYWITHRMEDYLLDL